VYYRKAGTTSGHKISVKRRSFNCAVLPSSKEKPFRMLSSEGFHLLSSVVMYGYGSSCDVFLIRRLLAATIGTVHALSVDVFAFQFYHASVYQSIKETSHTHNFCTPFQ
jgi:hypothetical protein